MVKLSLLKSSSDTILNHGKGINILVGLSFVGYSLIVKNISPPKPLSPVKQFQFKQFSLA